MPRRKPSMVVSFTLVLLFGLLSVCAALESNASVAIVGAGPHGLVAALKLKQLGFNVTVFEKEQMILPIIESPVINGVVYDYLSQALLPAASTNGSGPPSVLLNFAERYGQPLEPLLTASTSFDSVAGVNPIPSTWLPFLADPSGPTALLQQLAAGYAVLRELDDFRLSPSGALESGIVLPNQTFAEWADDLSLPAFTDLITLLTNTALSGPASEKLAADIISPSRLYIPGGLRQAILLQGINSTSPEALSANLTSLLEGDPTPAYFYHLPNGVRALFQAALQSDGLEIQLGTPVTSVANDGTVTYAGGQQKYDHVIVSARPGPAAAMLPPPLSDVYENAHTGLADTFILNATSLPNATNLNNHLETPFLGFVTVASDIPPADGSPSYIVKLDSQAPVVCVGSYVTPNVNKTESLAKASSALAHYGLNVSSVIEYSRVAYSSWLTETPQIDHHENVFLLGEVFSGIGIVTALEYVPDKINEWFDGQYQES